MNRSEVNSKHVDVIIIGGGLAGLTAAAIVVRAGRSVVVLERASQVGGRAVTHVRQGVHLNLGPHALYCRGRASRVLKDLGVEFSGRHPVQGGGLLLNGDESYPIPLGIGTLIAARLLSWREKARLVWVLSTLPRLDARRFDQLPLCNWVEQTAGTGNLARLLHFLFRVSTYVDDAGRMSAGAAIDQLKLALAGNVWYLDGGWQTLVDGLRDRAVGHGTEIRTGAGVEAVRTNPDGVSVGLAGGEILHGRSAILAVGPKAVCDLLDLPSDAPLSRWTRGLGPVRAACLDVALDRLPRPGVRVAFGLDSPLYYSVHSASARLAPEGVAVLHAMKYLSVDQETSTEEVEGELERLLDRLQPGWRSRVVVRRFLPAMTVAQSLPRADESGLRGRPGVTLSERPNVLLAGDWVGPAGMLADASAASAEEAARRVLAMPERPFPRPERSPIHVAS